jgi:hypothetical protein
MVTPRPPDDEDISSSEDRFARQDFQRHSRLSSAVAVITVIVITIAAVLTYLAVRR